MQSCGVLCLSWRGKLEQQESRAVDPSTKCVHAAVSRCVKLWSPMFGFIDNDIQNFCHCQLRLAWHMSRRSLLVRLCSSTWTMMLCAGTMARLCEKKVHTSTDVLRWQLPFCSDCVLTVAMFLCFSRFLCLPLVCAVSVLHILCLCGLKLSSQWKRTYWVQGFVTSCFCLVFDFPTVVAEHGSRTESGGVTAS